MYQQIRLSDASLVGPPGPVPANLVGLSDAVLADLSAAIEPAPPGFDGQGFWPVVVTTPSYDASRQVLVPPASYAADPDTKTVAGTATVRNMTADEYAAANSVPARVTNYQARRAIRAAKLFDQVDAAIRAAGDPDFVDAWDYANEFLRDDPVILALPAALNPPLTSDQIDELFRVAARFS